VGTSDDHVEASCFCVESVARSSGVIASVVKSVGSGDCHARNPNIRLIARTTFEVTICIRDIGAKDNVVKERA